jgi:hypothetical protein
MALQFISPPLHREANAGVRSQPITPLVPSQHEYSSQFRRHRCAVTSAIIPAPQFGTGFAEQRCPAIWRLVMLAFYLPFLVLDAAFDLCAANVSMWQLLQREPVVVVMETKAGRQ